MTDFRSSSSRLISTTSGGTRLLTRRRPRFAVRPLALALAGGSLLSLLPGMTPNVQAQAVPPAGLPSGLTVVQGQVKAVTTGKDLTVTNSSGSILNWQSFSIGAGNAVTFVQPNAQSQVLNRVVGNDPSAILGSLSSNGKVWLLNPNGVLFGQGARIDVGGLVTSTLNLNDVDWLNGQSTGRFNLFGNSSASIVNQGELRSSLGGHIALLGGTVRNEGLIEAPNGQILLAAGKSIELIDTGSPNLRLRVTAPEGEALNLGTLQAAGGRIDVHGAVVNQLGIVRADSLGTNAAGEIVLTASESLNLGKGSITSASGATGGKISLDSATAGTTMVSGEVLATGSAGLGGSVTLLGKNVGIIDSAKVDASGSAGGGQIHVGGGERGQDPTYRNSDGVYIGRDASLIADATTQGDGGKIVLWANEATRAYGSFSARGGPLGGNGGFIETSGGWIDVRPATISATAPAGLAGTWLIDPYDLLIKDTGPDQNVVTTSGAQFSLSSGGSPAVLSTATINAALAANNNVEISTLTTLAGSEAGDITLDGATITYTGTGLTLLTVHAANDLKVRNSTISSTGGGPLTLSLVADRFFEMTNSSTTMTGGRVWVYGAGFTSLNSTVFDKATFTFTGPQSGSVLLQAGSNDLRVLNSTISSTGGAAVDVMLRAGTFTELSKSVFNTTGGAVTVIAYGTVPPSGGPDYALAIDNARMTTGGGAVQLLTNGSVLLKGSTINTSGGRFQSNSASGPIGSTRFESTTLQTGGGNVSISGSLDGSAGYTFGPGVEFVGNFSVDAGAGSVDVTGSVSGGQFGGDLGQSTGVRFFGNGGISAASISITGTAGDPLPGGSNQSIGVDGYFSTTLNGTNSVAITGSGRDYGVRFNAFGQGNPLTVNGGSVAISGTSAAGGLRSTVLTGSVRGSSVQVDGNRSVELFASLDSTAGTAVSSGDSAIFRRAVTAGGQLTVRSDDVQLAPGGSLASNATGDAIVVSGVAGTANARQFTNAAGESALSAASGRWLVYSTDPATDTVGSLAYAFKQYNAVVGLPGGSPAGSGNGLLYALAPTVTATGGTLNKVYDATTQTALLPSSGVVLGGGINGDSVGFSPTGRGSYADKNVGNGKSVTIASDAFAATDSAGKPVYGYGYTGSLSGNITPKPITIGASAQTKVYDGGTGVTLQLFSPGTIGDDDVRFRTTGASFGTPGVGNEKVVTIPNLTLAGADRLNYTVDNPGATAIAVANITPAPLTVTANNASKTYGSTLTFAGSEFTSSGLAGSESIGSVSLSSTGAPASATVAGGPYAIVASNATGGSFSAANYTITYRNGSLTVTPAAVNAVLASIVGTPTKAYDGSTAATLAAANYSLSGFVGSDSATVSKTSGSYDSANTGPRTVTTALASGDFTPTGSTDLRNYTLPTSASGSGTITPRTLTLTGLAANNKVYDGTLAATLGNGGTLNGLVAGQTLTVSNTSASFNTKDAGTGKTVTVAGITLGNGTGLASNYQVSGSATTTADINPKTLTLSGLTAANKVYDGNTTASVSFTGLSGLVGNETLGTTTSGSFDTKDAGTAKTVTVGVTLANGSNGELASNYRVAPTATTTADITPKALTVTANDANKAYGNTLTFNGNEFSSSGLVGSETIGSVRLSSTGAAAAASVAAGPYPIVASNAVGGSFSIANYNVRYVNGTLTVNPAALNAVLASIVGNPTKAYDGNNLATLSATNFGLSGFVGSDSATVTKTSGTYSSADAGSRTVSTTLANGDFSPVGSTDLRNYTLPTTASGSGTITQKTVTLTGVAANNKIYDGSTVASLSNTGTLAGLVAGQTLTLSNTGASFDTKDAGAAKTVTVAGIALGNGTGLASNYQVAASATTTADINPKTLTLSGLTAANKVYDGNTTASVSFTGLSGLVNNETLGTTTSGSFDTKDAGTAKTVTVGVTLANGSSGSNGGLASNYRVAPTTTTTADITPKALTVTANDANKAYGNTLTFNGNEFSSSGLVGSETIGSVRLSSTGAAAAASVAAGPYPIVASNAVGGSFSIANYNVRYVNGTLTVNPAALNAVLASIVGNPTKAYDGNNLATLSATNFGLSGFVGSDSATVTKTSGTYSSADAGSRTVSTTLANGDFSPVGSTDLRNYTLPTTASGSGTITQKTVTLTGVAANNKIYDGSTVASLSNTGTLAGLVAGQTLTVSNTGASFNTKDAGTGKTVTVAGIALGNGTGLASNYQVAASATTTADINQKTLTLSGLTAANKVYDGNTTASVSFTGLSGLVNNETLGTTTSGSFDTKDAGTAKTVTVGVTLANGSSGSNGGLASNYRVAPTTTTTADITPKALTVTANDANKAYGNTLTFNGNEFSSSGLVGSETIGSVRVSSTGAAAAASVAAGPYPIVASNAVGGSFSIANYNVRYVNGTLTVNPAALNAVLASIVGNPTKVYDGNNLATLSATNFGLSGFVGSDSATVTKTSGTYSSADAGSRTVSTTLANGDFSPVGSTDLRNYTLPTTASGSGTIIQKTVTLTGVAANNKTYDGSTVASLSNTGTLAGLVAGQTLTVSNTSASFNTKDAGTGKTVTVAGITLGNGTGLASNYQVSGSATTTADINPKTLTLSGLTAANKVYDGNTTASVSFTGLSGLVGNETLGTTTSGSFDTKDAGTAKTVTVGVTLANGSNGELASNYRVAPTATTTADITPKALTVTANDANKAYGNTLIFNGNEFSSSGLVGSETIGSVRLSSTGAAAAASVAAGPYPIVASNAVGGSFSIANYNVRYVNGTLTVNPAALNAVLASIVGNPTKVYDGNNLATLSATNFGLSGFVGSDSATVTKTSGTYSSADAGSRTVSTTLANGDFSPVGSTDLRNYTLPTTASGSGTIIQKTVTLTGVAANNKIYDGSTVASLSNTGTLAGLVAGQTLTVSNTGASFNTKDAGTGKTVTVAGIALGNGTGLASNYQVAASATTTADINPKTLTLSGLTAANKVYDGNTTASVTLSGLTGLVGNETLGTTTNGSFDTKDAGTAKPVTVGVTLANGSNGGLANNYQLAPSASTTADITPRTLTVSSTSAANKVYDGNTIASVTLGGLTGLVGNETLVTAANGSFDTKDAGSAKTVTVGVTLANGSNGGLASNYRVAPTTTGTADITQKTLTLSGLGAANKVYDGTTLASVTTGALNGLVGNETLGVSTTSAQFDTKDVGTAKLVTVAGIGLSNGTGLASNYRVAASATTSADITPAPLTVTANNAAKTFGETLNFTGTEFTSTALAGTETLSSVSLASAGAAATASVAGGPYAITASNATGSGFDARNYDVLYANGSLTVNPANLSAVMINIIGNPTKAYDGTTVATLNSANFGLTGFIGSDAATITQTSGRYDSANAGSRTVTVNLARTDYAAAGSTDLRNYALPVVASGSGTIVPRPVTASGGVAANKAYDGNTAATVTGVSLSGLVGTETLAVASASARFDTKDAGTGKTVTVTGIALANGTGLAGNYALSGTTASTTADITPKALTVTASNASKTFGTSLGFVGNEFVAAGLVGSETIGSVGLNSTGAAASASVAGGPYAIVASNAGGGSFSIANYNVSYVNGTLTVNPAELNAVLANIVGNPTKVYDGTAIATLSASNFGLTGFVGSDSATITKTAGTYSSADAGSRTVSTTLANGDFNPVGSTDLRNYTLPTTASGAGTITQKTVTLTGVTANNKVYDGTAAASLSSTGTLTGLVGGQALTVSTTGATFDTKDAGTAKIVTVGGIALANGTGLASNYRIAPTATTTADITPKTLTLSGLSAANKTYDGNTTASVTLSGLSGLVGTEALGTSLSGNFDTKDAGTAKTVTVGTTLANGSNGGLASNYRIGPSNTTANVTPATLTYTANPANKIVGAPTPALSGAVSGFVANETLASATTGNLAFVTPATATSPAGSYAVDGAGLAATNYRFVQAPGNASALTVTGLEPQQIDEGSKSALGLTLATVAPKKEWSSPDKGRVFDAVQAMQAAVFGQLLLFNAVPVGNMSFDSLSALLASRDRYKKALFADAIHQLELDPSLADARACTSIADAESGSCLITEKIKEEIRAQRVAQAEAEAAAAAAATRPAPAASGAAAAAAPAPETPAAKPATPAVRQAAPLFSFLRRNVRTASLPQIERKIAVVIGTNQYADKSIPQLENAVGDAEAVGKLLESTLGYETIVLTNSSKQSVVRTLNRLAVEVGPKDSVVVYYAGHGELIESTGLGYWQLADSDAKKPETWLSNADISRLVKQIGASQVALISDSCYSGSLVDERIRASGTQTDPRQLLGRKTVVVMSSGGNEPVFDAGKEGHSPFAYNLMSNLRQVTTWQAGGNVFERVRFAVARELPQRPHYGAAAAAGHQSGGDYLFEQRQLDAIP